MAIGNFIQKKRQENARLDLLPQGILENISFDGVDIGFDIKEYMDMAEALQMQGKAGQYPNPVQMQGIWKRMKDNAPDDRWMWLTFSSKDEKGTTKQRSEYNIFRPDWNKIDSVSKEVIDRMIVLAELIEATYPAHTESFDPFYKTGINITDDMTEEEQEAEINKMNLDSKFADNVIIAMAISFKQIVDNAGEEAAPIRLKNVYDKTGKYVNLPKYSPMFESMEIPVEQTKLSFSKYEKDGIEAARNPRKAEATEPNSPSVSANSATTVGGLDV